LRNAEAEGVVDRIELRTCYMTTLPFSNDSFDFVLSNVAVHNMKGRDRHKPIAETVRVLRPGGGLLIAHITSTRDYVAQCATLASGNTQHRAAKSWLAKVTDPWLRRILSR
jgi:ubiquinone/menaquinone biosynthesis C-methylase UbiE